MGTRLANPLHSKSWIFRMVAQLSPTGLMDGHRAVMQPVRLGTLSSGSSDGRSLPVSLSHPSADAPTRLTTGRPTGSARGVRSR